MSRARRTAEIVLVAVVYAIDLLVWGGDRTLRGGAALPWWLIPTCAVAIYGALLLRARRPRLIFAVQWGYALAGLAVPGYEPLAGLLVALHAIARRGTVRAATIALAACVVPFGIDSYNSAAANGQSTPRPGSRLRPCGRR